MKFLLGTVAYNSHIQNIALALYEAGALGAFYTGGVVNSAQFLSRIRKFVPSCVISEWEQRMARRHVRTIPQHLVHSDWSWEVPRMLVKQLSLGALVEDFLWHKSEYHFARKCEHLIRSPQFEAFFGIEFGSLEAVRTAHELGKKGVIAFLSPHHSMREEWVDAEYEVFPELRTPTAEWLIKLAHQRDRRKDIEIGLADVIHTASQVTARSLENVGVPRERIITVPLGCPRVEGSIMVRRPSRPLRFLYSGSLAVHKGVLYLLAAWRQISGALSAELHLYGQVLLPDRCFDDLGKNVIVHGAVSRSELTKAYASSDVLIFPTLLDGFGMVVGEALAHGLPVIMTKNAGAADLIREGENGFLVPPRDADALAERIQWCLDHPVEVVAMREAAQNTARSWTWAHFRASFRKQLGQKLGISFDVTNCKAAEDCSNG